MDLYPHQAQTVSSPARFKVQRGGRRGGKTVIKQETILFKSISKLVPLSREFKNRTSIFIAPTQKQARTIVWEELKNRMTGIGQANESRLEMRIPNELGGTSTIMVGGWENRENYRGMSNVVHIEFDEVDTMRDFFIGWEEIFKPMLMETGGSAGFGGTPKKENPNLRRLEKQAEGKFDWACFHFTSWDNPNFSRVELEQAKREMDADTYRQEIMAEYVDNAGALFHYDALVDMFSNTVTKDTEKYMLVDIADDGSDKTVFSVWEGLEEIEREEYAHMNTENIIDKIREKASAMRIPFSHIAVDAIGVGAGVASSSLLNGIIGFKSSYAPIKTDTSIVQLPNVHYSKNAPLTSEYRNLRSQCVFLLADHVNNHKIASRVTGVHRERTIEELALYQDASSGDGKRMATQKEDIKELLGRSPDHSDCAVMRMYFVIRAKMTPEASQEYQVARSRQEDMFSMNRVAIKNNSTK